MSRTACSGSAVESTIIALRPPVSAISMASGAAVSASCFSISLATSVEPVKQTPAMRGSAVSGAPTEGPSPGKSWMTSFGEWLLRSTLRKTLLEKANWFMDKSLKDLKTQVQDSFNRPLAPGLNMRGLVADLKPGQPQVLPDGFKLDATLEGQVQIEFTGGL